MSKFERNRQHQLRDFANLCERVGFQLEPFQEKIASALLDPEREKLVTLPRKNGKSRLIGTFAAFHLLTTPRAQAYIAANSEEQARVMFEYARRAAPDRSLLRLMPRSFCTVCRARIAKGSRCSRHTVPSPSSRSWPERGAAAVRAQVLERDRACVIRGVPRIHAAQPLFRTIVEQDLRESISGLSP